MGSAIRPAPRSKRRRWRASNGLLIPTAEAVADAIESIPDGPPWAWAALRVMPAVTGERVQVLEDAELDRLGFELTTSSPYLVMPPGVDVTFAMEIDVVRMTVTQRHLDAWDMGIEQLVAPAMANLRRVVGMWRGRVYLDDSYPDIPARMLDGWPHWATSLLLLPDELIRIFGSDDQIFVAPYACNLISLPVAIDRDIAADLVDMYGVINPRSLLRGLPAFVMRDGALAIEELPGLPDLPEEWRNDEADSTGGADQTHIGGPMDG